MGQIIVEDVRHIFKMGKIDLQVLFGINLEIQKGEFISLCGSSGSGKSTLLNLIAGLMRPTNGNILFNNIDITSLTENELCLFRQNNLGFVFQNYNLLPNLTAIENVELPLIFAGVNPKERKKKAQDILGKIGLGERINHRPGELSGGQQQRVSIARALVNNPPVILADEPTGNLDSVTGTEILNLMRTINEEDNITFVIVTHDLEQAKLSDRVIHLRDGVIINEEVLI